MTRLRRRAALGLLGAAALARPLAAQGRTVVDSAGRTVVLPERVTRVFVAGPPASVLVYALAPDLLAGWVRAPSPAEQAYLRPAVRNLPETGRLTGRGDSLSLERLVAARPDLVVDFGSVGATYVSLADRVQQQTGIPYLLIDGSFAATAAALRLAGRLLDRAERGEALAAYAERTLALVDSVLARVAPEHRPRVYLARGPEGLETGGRGSINSEILERVGAVNVAEGLGGRGNTGNASLEQVLAWQPDTIVTLDARFFREVRTRPGWQDLAAVRDGRVFLSPSLPWGWIDAPPSINRLIGLRWLLATLYPQAAGLDLRGEARTFYAMVYGVTLDAAQLDRLLAAER